MKKRTKMQILLTDKEVKEYSKLNIKPKKLSPAQKAVINIHKKILY